jgi:hypothetical protein
MGVIKYRETHSTTTDANGMFSVNVGQGTPVSGTFAGINWNTNAKFMQVELDPAGGSSYVDMGTQQMMSVPYSLNGLPSGIGGDNLLHITPGPGVAITSGSTGYIISASATSADDLQDVTTRGNETSQSIIISNDLFITGSDNGIRISGPSGHLVLTSSNLILTGSSYLVLQNWEFLEFGSDFDAEQAGVPSGGIYRNGNFLMIRTGSAN